METKRKLGSTYISDKIDFKTKTAARDKEGYHIMMKGSIQQESITIVNMCIHNIGAPKCIQRMLTKTKGEIESNTIVGDINRPLISTGRSCRQKINMETLLLNDRLDHMDFISLMKFKKIEITPSILFYNNANETVTIRRKKPAKKTNVEAKQHAT